MYKITIPGLDKWNEITEEFVSTKEQTLQLEHSLVSISKWESKWHKSFLDKGPETYEELIDYIRCMTLTQNVNPDVYYGITPGIINEIYEYMNEPMTATWFSNNQKGGRREVVTSEVIYCWMFMLNIPMECQKWHINRLMTLIRVCGEKNAPSKKMNRRDQMAQQRSLNAARRAKHHSRG